ncbi:hypothetical protein BGW38_006516 [Lunasporangiospora selenospora]|uniref:Uncharacterized protein n=1 Tax=Lunasporangiospora selenospora TaxID=979761 RepID=A0A9P6FM35_9FUNG|nr:hypothetical protein BGW38_006516 [Lunasporangiospora selenospora]
MIVSLPYFVISSIISFVKLTFSLFIGAALVFYAKNSQDEYANSIRWSRTGGLLEMIQLLWSSYRLVPRRSSAAMAIVIIASIFALSVSTILTTMVSPVIMEGASTAARAFTMQLISTDNSFWDTYLNSESTVEETLTSMLNDTRRNPNSRPGNRYTPRTFAYEAGCDESIVAIVPEGLRIPAASVKCKGYFMTIQDDRFWDFNNTSFQRIDSNTSMVVIPAARANPSQTFWGPNPTFIAASRNNQLCFQYILKESMDIISTQFPKDGMITLPKTFVTKCQYGSKGSLVFSETELRFAVGRKQDFDNITATILDDPISLPLLKTMTTAINAGAFESPTNHSTLVMFSKPSSTGSDVDFFGCLSRYREEKEEMSFLCTYTLTSFIIVKPQAVDPVIANDLNRELEVLNRFGVTNQLDFTISHLPQISEYENSHKTSLFSSAHLIEATANATQYLASLGHNVYVYSDPGSIADTLYILYDTVELKLAYEVSLAAYVVVYVFAALFLSFWILSRKLFPTVYNSSLYKTIYTELSSKDESVPMLMRYTHGPLAFDDNQVVPDSDEQPSIIPETTSQGIPMTSLHCHSNVPSQQQEQQSLPPFMPSHFTQGSPSTPSIQARPHGTATHGGEQTLVSSTHQGPTRIQSPFE